MEAGCLPHQVAVEFVFHDAGLDKLENSRALDLSAVGNGLVWLESDGSRTPGTYSLEGDDCRNDRASCTPLPELAKRFQLGGGERGEKKLVGLAAG